MVPAGLLHGLVASLGWGLTDVTAALAGRRIGALPLALGAQLVGLLPFVVLAVLSGGPVIGVGAESAALFGAIIAVGYVAAFAALATGPLAVASPVIASAGALSVLLAVTFRGESLSTGDWAGVALATIGVVFAGVVMDGGARPRLVSRGVAYAVVAAVGFAVGIVGLAAPIEAAGWLPATVMSRAAAAGTLLVIALGVRRRAGAMQGDGAPRSPLRLAGGVPGIVAILAVAAFDTVATASFALGLEVGQTWLVGLTSSFGPAIAVVVGVGALGERPRRAQWAGIGALAAAIGVLALPA